MPNIISKENTMLSNSTTFKLCSNWENKLKPMVETAEDNWENIDHIDIEKPSTCLIVNKNMAKTEDKRY
eukprot:13711726-Ditylum_brightwellii.AAC.1